MFARLIANLGQIAKSSRDRSQLVPGEVSVDLSKLPGGRIEAWLPSRWEEGDLS